MAGLGDMVGPSYPYWNNINSPDELGMSANGDMNTLGNDINGLIGYVEVLVQGDSIASKTGRPLGNRFFLKTAAKCTPQGSSGTTDRYIYVDNVPSGNIPFISSGMGTNFTDLRGLIPGAMDDLAVLNPGHLLTAFSSGTNPPCQNVSLQTIDINNNISSETHYVTLTDIANINPCSFNSGNNPVTKASCNQGFANMKNSDRVATNSAKVKQEMYLPDDPIIQIYFACLGLIGIYILYCILLKNKRN
jgi:hypothetical protein